MLVKSEENAEKHDVPLVWVHDYHLMLAANWIRQMAEEANITLKLGFFLHIPFPPWDIFRLFPWSDEILQGMLGKEKKMFISIIPVIFYEVFKYLI